MPITTYAGLDTLRPTTDADICEALAGLLPAPIVEERLVYEPQGRWRWHRAWCWRYRVLWFIADTLAGPEWQMMHFYRDHDRPDTGIWVPKALVLAYLHGVSAGQHRHGEEPG